MVLTYIVNSHSEDRDKGRVADEQLANVYRAALHWLEYDKRSEVELKF